MSNDSTKYTTDITEKVFDLSAIQIIVNGERQADVEAYVKIFWDEIKEEIFQIRNGKKTPRNNQEYDKLRMFIGEVGFVQSNGLY